MIRVVINGRALGNSNNGIPQFVREVLTHIDQIIDKCNDGIEIEVVVPEGNNYRQCYRKIKYITLPDSYAWDFLQAEKYARKRHALYVTLANNGCFYRHCIATFHDIRVLRMKDVKPSWRSLKTHAKVAIAYQLATHRAEKLATVSEFSRREISNHSKIKETDIEVVGSGWDHLLEFQKDESVFHDFPEIKRGEYYLSISSIAPHKNFQWITQNAKKYPSAQYVIVGKTDLRLWPDITDIFSENVIYLGYQSSEKIKALLYEAKALVFPSLYEGFGLPPLEALACGIPAIVSDIPVMHEIFGACVSYIQPDNADVDLELFLAENRADPKEILERYTWNQVAIQYLKMMKGMAMTK